LATMILPPNALVLFLTAASPTPRPESILTLSFVKKEKK
jgi:hypothetical protein